MAITLQHIFQHYFPQYPHKQSLSQDQTKAAQALMACCTDELGYEEWLCPKEGDIHKQPHSCKHRNCPQCNKAYTEQWLEKTQARLLPCDHYHVVFTLPHEFNDIWRYNPKWCANALFKTAAETLQQLLEDERYLGAKTGMLMSLHTWGRTLAFHPHVHVLITGGGLKGEQWQALKKDFLLPVGVIKAKFRGKWLDWINKAYAKGDIQLPTHMQQTQWKHLLSKVAAKSWNICIKGAYRHVKGITQYLARYVHGGPIKNHRLIAANQQQVCFRYHDYHDGENKNMTLSTEHFMSRIFWHIPAKGQHNLRYYGIYLPSAKQKRDIIRMSLKKETGEHVHTPAKQPRTCPRCGSPLMHLRSTRRQISSIKGMANNPLRRYLSNRAFNRTSISSFATAPVPITSKDAFFWPIMAAG